jgi:hypothetical protein
MIFDFDGWDDYDTAQLLREQIAIGSTPEIVSGGRNGGTRLYCSANEYVRRLIPTSPSTLVVSFIHRQASLGTSAILEFRDTNYASVGVEIFADGSIGARRASANASFAGTVWGTEGTGSVSLGVSDPGVLLPDVDQRIDVAVVIHPSAGAITIRVNGLVVLDLTDIDTVSVDGVATVTNVVLGRRGAGASYFDDYYAASDYLGTDVRVDSHYPVADGANTDFTPSTGSDHFALVDEAVPDDDTTKVTATAPDSRDTYKVEAYKNPGGTIYATKTVLTGKKVEANSAQLATCIRSGGANYDGTPAGLSVDWMNIGQVDEVDPDTEAAWAESAFGAAGSAEFGVHKAA